MKIKDLIDMGFKSERYWAEKKITNEQYFEPEAFIRYKPDMPEVLTHETELDFSNFKLLLRQGIYEFSIPVRINSVQDMESFQLFFN